MKKVLILLMFVSLGLVGQTPKMEIVVGTTENVDGITVTSKNTAPSSHNYSIYGLNKSTTYNGIGVYGGHEGSGTGVHGYSKSGTGVSGFSQMGTFGSGVYGLAYGAGKSGVKGYSENGYGNGILGEAESGIGVKGYALNFFSTTGIGGHFSNAFSTGYALVTGTGKVGIGTETPVAKMDIMGTSYLSHFFYGTPEDTYIRGGKAGSKVLINDIAGMGSVGIGLSNPNELLDVNGRMRIRHNVNTSGLWMSNSTNSLNGADGAFYGMKTDTETGIYIGNAWRFWVNNNGQVTSTSLAGAGNRPLLADANGVISAASSSQTLLLQPSHFHALSSSSPIIRTENSISLTGAGTIVAPINLPVGAKINSIILRVKDNTSSGFALYSLEKMSTATNVSLQLSSDGSTIGSSNSSAINWLCTNSLPVTIATNNYYYISVTGYDSIGNLISWASGSTFDFRWIEIQYTF
ncbi:hypothetical protein EGI26_15665 [Lacihabitans sp. CCS-44]|uniref:hypothetical protein n=1 Tax=Lacihabitans sp. CCS-44 TaxID=2487331 RepID=UPI0020CBB14F|nr:hypothetical protein [Lacihabitans sp. CCS-44]MCP9756602.1 hypothetical protein [Lacihabitans sp. CCS-44]